MILSSLGAGALGLVVGYDVRRFAAATPAAAAYASLSTAMLVASCCFFVGVDGALSAMGAQAFGAVVSHMLKQKLHQGRDCDAR